MPTAIETVLLFPGQGAHRDDALPALARRHPQVAEVFDEVDSVAAGFGARQPGADVLAGRTPVETLRAERPDVLQLAIFATSIGLWRVMRDSGRPQSVLVGHSSGEIAALVAGGAFTLAEGTEIVVRRSSLLEPVKTRSAGMVALGCDARRAWQLVDAVADPRMVVAVENGPAQTVVSGPEESLSALAAIAGALRIAATTLPAAYPFHSPVLAPLVADFAAEIAHLEARPFTALVYSPILGRFHRQGDRLTEHLAASLVAPVRFGSALRELSVAGARTFVDCSVAAPLARLTLRCLPGVTAIAAEEAASATAAPVAATPVATPTPVSATPVAAATPAPVPATPVAAATPVALATAPAADGASPETRDAILAELADMYATALEYPVEVFTEDVALEADLGIDSVKQTELLARAAERYGLPEPPADFRLGDYDTMGKVVDYLWSARGAAPPVAASVPEPAGEESPETRDAILAELADMYATALEYPVEVFTEDVALEADLGIDSVKQTELLARAAERYGLPEPPADFRLGDYDTMGKVVDYLWSARGAAAPVSDGLVEVAA